MATTVVVPIQQIHVADAGLAFQVSVRDGNGPVNLSRATVKQYLFQKPDGSMLVVDVDFVTDGADGMLIYVTLATDFDQDGTWSHQVYYRIGPSQSYSNITKFRVYPNLPLAT